MHKVGSEYTHGMKIGEMAKRTDASADKKIMFANASLEKMAKK